MVQINWVGTDRANYTAGNFRKVGFILHWMAGGLPGTTSIFRPGGSADYSTGYGIGTPDGKGDGPVRIDQYVRDNDRAFGSANPDADRKGISIEMENNYRGPKSPWYINPPTYKVLEVVAQFMAQKVREHDMRINGKQQLVLADFPDHRYYGKTIPDFGVRYNVITHRSMALKDCPGTTDIQWVVNRGNEILGASDKPAPTPEEIEEAELMAAKDDIVNALSGKINDLNNRLSDVERSVNDRVSSLVGIITREGRDARAYQNSDTGEVFIADPGVFFVSLAGQENPEASVNLYAADGWVQDWKDRKVYPTERFEFVKRQYLRTVAGTQPLPPVQSQEGATQ